MKKENYIELIAAALILLFVYAALSKAADFSVFTIQLRRQPFPDSMVTTLAWALPATELLIGLLLGFMGTRLIGLYIALLLMILFTGYILLILAGVFDNVPCSCGGVLSSLDWIEHFWFNISFTVLTLTGVILSNRRGKTLRDDIIYGESSNGKKSN